MSEEEPISGSQGLELSRDDVAEGQADVAIWLQTEVIFQIRVSVYSPQGDQAAWPKLRCSIRFLY